MNMYINLCVLSQSVVPHSLWPHRLQAARVLCPWDCCCSIAQSCLTLCNPMDCARQASLSLTISPSLPRFMSIASVMPSSHLILWYPLFFLPSIFPSIRDFSNESAVHIWWPKHWSFGFSISLSNEYSGLISLKIYCFDLLAVQETLEVLSSTTFLKHQFFGILPSLWSSSHNRTWPLGRP